MPRKAKAAAARGEKVRRDGEGSVWQEGNRWRWRVSMGVTADKKRLTRQGSAESEKAALDAVAQARADYTRGLIGAGDQVTVAEFAARWVRRQHGVTGRTVKKYGQELEYALEHIGEMRVQSVRSHHLKDVVAKLAVRSMKHDRAMSRSTLGRIVTRLRALFREAVADQIIYVNPMDGVKMPKVKANETAQVKALGPNEAARLVSLGGALFDLGLARLWPALFLALGLGLRRGEVLGLTWADVDLDAGTVSINQTRVMDVKGIKTGKPKTANSRRTIHLPGSVAGLLTRHRTAQAEEKAQAGSAWRDTGAVFATTLGDWTHPDNLNRALRAVIDWSDPAKAAKTGRGSPWQGVSRETRDRLHGLILAGEKLPAISPHDLRHTYATLALRQGVALEVVSKNLGHGNPSVTLNIYRHVLDDELRSRVVDLFPDAIPLPRPPLPATALN